MNDFRRPIPVRAQDIGMWGPILNFLTYLGILTNPLIIILTSSWGKDLPTTYKFLIFLGFEHIVFAGNNFSFTTDNFFIFIFKMQFECW